MAGAGGSHSAEAESKPLLEVDIKDDGINWEEYFKRKFSHDFDKK